MITSELQARRKTIEFVKAKREIEGNCLIKKNRLIYIFKGKASFYCGYRKMGEVTDKSLVFFPEGSRVEFKLARETQFLVFNLNEELRLSNSCCLEQEIVGKMDDDSSHILVVADPIVMFMESLRYNLQMGLDSERYLNMKISELEFMISAIYPKEQLVAFFNDAYYRDSVFSDWIWNNHRQFANVKDLARSMNYTVSGFEKRFRKIFGQPPYTWMKEQKAKLIHEEVCATEYNFKEIADRYNFASPSTFNDFYKRVFGETPGVARKKAKKGGNEVYK